MNMYSFFLVYWGVPYEIRGEESYARNTKALESPV